MLKSLWVTIFLFISTLAEATSWNITGIVVDAPARTSKAWVEEYLGFVFPIKLDEEALRKMRAKLLNTDVFLEASVVPTRVHPDKEEFVLTIQLKEKWTTIPVVRGAFGGGTPLRVFGIYDTHSFGSLWTLGAETRKYGDAQNSYVVWARAPRWKQGHHYINSELWQLNRIRSFYDDEDQEWARIASKSRILRLGYLHPLLKTAALTESSRTFQAGLDLELRAENPATLIQTNPPPSSGVGLKSIDIPNETVTETSILPTVVYDDIEIFGIRKNGIRTIAQAGVLTSRSGNFSKYIWEGYGYKTLGINGNLATRWFVGATKAKSLNSQYFLGGLESVRGLPDGAIFGSQAAYTNIEYRHMLARYDYTWWQGAVFLDTGAAGATVESAIRNKRSSAGLGIRIAVPQVYRLMFRIDYARSLDRAGTSGISIGLNQFFQPYRPL